MSKLMQLSPNSWLLRSRSGEAGLLFKTGETYLYMSQESRAEFATYADVEKRFGTLAVEERVEEEEVSNIKGYPVKHQGITVVSEDPPQYTTGGKVVFAAGYWGLKFTNGWTQAYCPKVDTTVNNESVGPFKNRLEMLNHLSTLNTADAIKGSK
jgi:hypothetical protein